MKPLTPNPLSHQWGEGAIRVVECGESLQSLKSEN
jgi:hypothetical protein